METKDLVCEIAKALVDSTEEVKVNEVNGEHTSVIELKVAPSDIGKIIGKKGRTAKAIRDILSSVSAKLDKRFIFEIIE